MRSPGSAPPGACRHDRARDPGGCDLAVLAYGHGRFWSAGPSLIPAAPVHYPAVDVVIPARDEAEGITDCLRSLLAQTYRGTLRLILVDDGSSPRRHR